MSDMSFTINSRVRVTGAPGTVIGRIEEIRKVAELPDLPDAGVPMRGPYAPRSILQEIGAERVALISYKTSPDNELIFAALEIGGEWFDLNKQKLEIETVWMQ
jgi:hypothetical protein